MIWMTIFHFKLRKSICTFVASLGDVSFDRCPFFSYLYRMYQMSELEDHRTLKFKRQIYTVSNKFNCHWKYPTRHRANLLACFFTCFSLLSYKPDPPHSVV